MPDRIQIVGIETYGYHGVLAGEQEQGQPFSVDVELEVDLAAAAESDDLADTVDYGALAERIHAVVEGERWNLIERLAARIARVVLEDARVEVVTVTVHKPQAPIRVPFGDVSVTVQRRR